MTFFAPIGSHVNENEKKKKRENCKMHFFFKKAKASGCMGQGKQQLKFERNPCPGNYDTDEGRTTDDLQIPSQIP